MQRLVAMTAKAWCNKASLGYGVHGLQGTSFIWKCASLHLPTMLCLGALLLILLRGSPQSPTLLAAVVMRTWLLHGQKQDTSASRCQEQRTRGSPCYTRLVNLLGWIQDEGLTRPLASYWKAVLIVLSASQFIVSKVYFLLK